MVNLPQPCAKCGTALYNYNGACHNPECGKPTPPPDTPAGIAAWNAFVAAARAYAAHLDQWDKVKFETDFGTVYVTIGRSDPYPDSFEEISS